MGTGERWCECIVMGLEVHRNVAVYLVCFSCVNIAHDVLKHSVVQLSVR